MADCSQYDYVEINEKRMQLSHLIYYYLYFSFQESFSKPMFWIGMYIALASLVCTLAMAVDVIQGLRHRKLWFPCKIFALNAASLTLLAIAMKLPVDLATAMLGTIDEISKLSSMSFMCTAMANFLPSLGSMTNKELLANLTALGIMVITVVANVCIQFFTALAVPAIKEILEVKYHEKHKMVSNEESERNHDEKFVIGRLKRSVNKYWMMAESGAPQFVMASSVTCAASGAISFLNALNLAICWCMLRTNAEYKYSYLDSDYKYTTEIIACIQTVGVVAGTVGPAFRWLTAIKLEGSKKGINNYKYAFKMEDYWIKRLVVWKESPVSSQIRSRKYRKIVQGTKVLILNICIRVQIAIVVASKLVLLIPIFFMSMIKSCLPEAAGKELDLSHYVLQLEGEYQLPKSVLKNFSNALDELVQRAKKRQPKNLTELLKKCAGFKGVAEVDSEQVPRLLSDEPPKCWSLLVVTLTSIAIALPRIKSGFADQLLCSASEGLLYVRHIEKTLHNKEDLVNIEKAADLVWSRVELYHEWLDEDLEKMSLEGKTPEENLQTLGNIAKKIVITFKGNMKGDSYEDHLNWPVKVIAANSMYRTSQTIMLKYQANHNKTSEELFEQLSVMIADILGACLTNLPRAITTMCYCSAIGEREKSVKRAARLLGETEEIMKTLQQHEFSSVDPDQAPYLDEWVIKMKRGISRSGITSSESEISTASGELHLDIEQDN